MNTKTILTLAALSAGIFAPAAGAAVIVSAPTPTTSGSLQITEDITFTITANVINSGVNFVMDGAVVAFDGTPHGTLAEPDITIVINQDAPTSYGGYMVDDSVNGNQISPNDSYFGTALNVALVAGDTLTLKAGTYSLQPIAIFNPLVSQTFTGSMFVTDGSGNQVSNIVGVPEPSTFLLGALGILGLGIRHRRAASR